MSANSTTTWNNERDISNSKESEKSSAPTSQCHGLDWLFLVWSLTTRMQITEMRANTNCVGLFLQLLVSKASRAPSDVTVYGLIQRVYKQTTHRSYSSAEGT